MKKKKLLSFTLALALVFGSSLTVLADTGRDKDSLGTGTTITGGSEIPNVDTTVIEIDLPTDASLGKLIIDPLGLYGAANGEYTLDELKENAGKVFTTGTPVASNLSSVPLKVSVEMSIAGTNSTTEVITAGVVDDKANVDVSGNDPAANIMVYAVPSAEDVEGDEDNYVASSTGIVLPATGSVTADFLLDKADYKVSVSGSDLTFAKASDATSHSVALAFEGYLNKNADWNTFATNGGKFDLSVVYTFDKAAADDKVDEDSDAYGLMELANTVKTIEVEASSSSIPSSDGTTDIVIEYTGATPSSITLTSVTGGGTGTLKSTQTQYVTIAAGKVTIKKAYLATLKATSGYGTGTYKVTISGTDYKFVLR